MYLDKKLTAIIAAAGSSGRMGTGINKQFLLIKSKPVLCYSVDMLEKCRCVKDIIIITQLAEIAHCREILANYGNYLKVKCVIPGGKTRQESVWEGIKQAGEGTEYIAVHDGARPFASAALLEKLLQAAEKWGAAIPGIPVRDTMKTVDPDFWADQTLERSVIRAVQTPQVFRYDALKAAYEQARENHMEATDDAALFAKYAGKVKLLPGEPYNIKITTSDDLRLADFIAGNHEKNFVNHKNHGFSERKLLKIRIGYGYDAHNFIAGRPLIIGGVTIPYEKGLAGHSDADVLVHAICDAVLGALALGDIGAHFPDHNPRYKNISSLLLLQETYEMIRERGYVIINIDSTIVAQAPAMSPYSSQMRARIAKVLNIDTEQISVKATSTEGLGFEGRKEGIGATAVVLLENENPAAF
jgi:2-C-methyl-D-erythritol 4-phosphate cytidylyltransferase/2-C-methyl-D-erythritol 2,4-cyclodiphosphate synthase